MGDFWAGLLLGFLFGVIGNVLVNHYFELRSRFRAHAARRRLVGTWRAYDIHDRAVDSIPMHGAGDTLLTAKGHWWSSDSHVLLASGVDTSDGRQHGGTLVMDPVAPRLATRVLMYDSPIGEIVKQEVVIGPDYQTLYVFPKLATAGLATYGQAHALRKVQGDKNPRTR